MPAAGKRGRDIWNGSQASQTLTVDPPTSIVTVATIKTDAAVIQAYFGNKSTEESGSAVSLVRQDIVKSSKIEFQMPLPQIQLVTASGDKLPIHDCLKVTIKVQGEKFTHDLVVDKLITPVILGIDFLQKHQLTLNFSRIPVVMTKNTHSAAATELSDVLRPICAAHQQVHERYCGTIGLEHSEENIDECTVPKFDEPVHIEFPSCANPMFECVMRE